MLNLQGTDKDAIRAEMSAELKKARAWILAIGIIIFCTTALFVYVVYGDLIPDSMKTKAMIPASILLAVFIGLWVFAKQQPKLACILALVVFWGMVFYNASIDPKSLAQGIILKVFFTLALINGLKSASRAESLSKELGEVFE
jgi:hypothetical protein